jgi:hypothetical protein
VKLVFTEYFLLRGNWNFLYVFPENPTSNELDDRFRFDLGSQFDHEKLEGQLEITNHRFVCATRTLLKCVITM